jgi:hypothetical protein
MIPQQYSALKQNTTNRSVLGGCQHADQESQLTGCCGARSKNSVYSWNVNQHHAALRDRFNRPVPARRRENYRFCMYRRCAARCRYRIANEAVVDRSCDRPVMGSKCSSYWLELWQCDSVAAVFKNDLHRHIDIDVVDRAADDVAAETRPLVEIDPRGDIGNIRTETA